MEIDRTPFAIADRSLARMIEPSCKRLKPRGVTRRRKSATKISSDDLRFLSQEADRPNNIGQRKPAVLPIGDCVALPQAIQVHSYIDRKSLQRFDILGKGRTPIQPRHRMQPGRIVVAFGSPRRNPEPTRAACGPISK